MKCDTRRIGQLQTVIGIVFWALFFAGVHLSRPQNDQPAERSVGDEQTFVDFDATRFMNRMQRTVAPSFGKA